MDPISGLALACNIIDLVGKAINGGAAVIQVYKSVNGLSSANETINRAADSLRDIVGDLQKCQSRAPDNTANQKMRQISMTVISQCIELQSLIDGCRSSKKWGLFSAGKASAKSLRKSGKIQQLQNEIISSRDELFRWIAASTRADVEATLLRLKNISTTNCDISTTLDKINARLDVTLRSTEESPAENGAVACLDEVRQLVADRVILQLLDFPNLGSRFEEVVTQEEGTLEWIFAEPEVALQKEPQLATTFPDWLESGDGIFHICGKPGSGKSTLMKYLCRHPTTKELLNRWSGGDELLFAKFFFWRIGVVQEQRNMRGLIRGLLYQVLCKIPKLSRAIFSQTSRDNLVEGLQKRSGAESDSDEVMAAFSRLVEVSTSSSPSQDLRGIRICLFIDGLDEYDNTKIGQTYRELVQKLCQWTTSSNGSVKICVSSRIQEPFMQMLDESKRFTLHKLTGRDIELFVEQQLENHPKFRIHQQKSPRECQELIHKLRQSADGVFLYVALVLKDLVDGLDNGIPIDCLQRIISETPEELNTLLERIIGGINKSFRDGPEVLLAALLRATGTLLSPEDRGPEYVFFDEAPFLIIEDFNLSALGSFFILRAVDKGVSMQEDPVMDDFNLEKEEWFQDSMSDDEVMKAICTTVRARCNGLIDIVNGEYVKFTHRSIPEFLQTHFCRCSGSKLHDDHRATVVMSWSYLVDTRWAEVKNARGSSLASFLRGKSPSQPGQAAADVERDFTSEIESTAKRSSAFICRLRQIKLGDEWEDLFRILLFIDQALDRKWAVPPNVSARHLLAELLYGRHRYSSLIDKCAYHGLHEFINWLFRKTKIFADDTRRYRVMRSAIDSLNLHQYSRFSLMVMETMFAYGVDGCMVFPHGTGPDFEGQPLWHGVLRYLIEFDNLKHYYSFRHWRVAIGWKYKWENLMADVMELWFRHGANPQVRFQMSLSDGDIFMGVSSALDSKFIHVEHFGLWESMTGIYKKVAHGLQVKREDVFSLRDVVLYNKPHNELRLLELLPDDTRSDMSDAQEISTVEPDSSEISREHPAPPQEVTLSHEHLGFHVH
ncbi:hypothetical protein F5Y19DRAFT_477620 [Xylariaceae sp. FL1651]|nr:hypothetical protein F5Y19DRAFT_477620 [Xylariaceae sp. FL1651]